MPCGHRSSRYTNGLTCLELTGSLILKQQRLCLFFVGIVAVITTLSSHRTASAEWYAAGYGGLSAPQSLQNVKMDTYGERIARASFQNPDSTQATITQSFATSPIDLKHSPIFGGKAGYFFSDEGYRWLGMEVEAFTTQPSIKSQRVSTVQDVLYNPIVPNNAYDCTDPKGTQCPQQQRLRSQLQLQESSLRLITVAFNVVARYPGKVFQPYVGVGAGAFYFKGSTGSIQGRQVVPGLNAMAGLKVLVTEEFGLFLEGKYNRATLTNFDPTFGFSGEYSAFNFVAGVAYHF